MSDDRTPRLHPGIPPAYASRLFALQGRPLQHSGMPQLPSAQSSNPNAVSNASIPTRWCQPGFEDCRLDPGTVGHEHVPGRRCVHRVHPASYCRNRTVRRSPSQVDRSSHSQIFFRGRPGRPEIVGTGRDNGRVTTVVQECEQARIDGLLTSLREAEAEFLRSCFRVLQVVGEIDTEKVGAATGFGTTARLLSGVLNLSRSEATGSAPSRPKHSSLGSR